MDALIPPISSIIELELPVGIWTPHAAILCIDCHGDAFRSGKKLDAELFKKQPVDQNSDDEIAVCDGCGKDIWMDGKVAKEQRIVRALKGKGLDARMQQTGGMCSAAEIILDSDEDGGQKYVWITWSEDTRREPNDPTFMVGFYHCENPYGDDAEGEDYSILPFDEAVALAEKIVKEGRLNA